MKLRKIIIVLSIIIILVGAWFLMGLLEGMKEDPSQRPAEDLRRMVKTKEVAYRDIAATTVATGRLGSNQYVDVIAQVQGDIWKANVPLKKGQSFKKGNLLVRIDDRVAENNLKASKSRFLNLIANALPDFKIDYPEKYDDLMDFYNSVDIEKQLPEMPTIKSSQIKTFLASRNILTEYYTIKGMEANFENFTIYAPFNGSYTDVMLEVGAIVNPGSRIARIISTEKLELEVPVEMNNIKWLRVGDEVRVTSEDEAREWSGKIVRISDFVDPASQAASVFIAIKPDRTKPLYEGQYLKASFSGSIVESAMEIPRKAVYNFDEVFVVNDGKLRKRKVNVLKVNSETILFNGLEPGLDVVTNPLVNATEGTLVEISRK